MSDDILNQPITDTTTIGDLRARNAARQAASKAARQGYALTDARIDESEITLDGFALHAILGQLICDDIHVESDALGPDDQAAIVTIRLLVKNVHLGGNVSLDSDGYVHVDRDRDDPCAVC